MNSNNRQRTLRLLLHAFAILGFGVVIYNAFIAINSVTTTVYAQQDLYLDRRINQIEQRFTFIETRINRLEQQQSRMSGSTASSAGNSSEIELRLLRSQIEIMQRRISEAECGLVKLDERTLTDTARQTRKKSSDLEMCRQNSNLPLNLTVYP